MAELKMPDNIAHYDLQRSESFWDIATHRLKDPMQALELAKLNNSTDFMTKMPAGWRIVLPDYTRYDYTVNYMLGEMLTNAKSATAQTIADAIGRSKEAGKDAEKTLEQLKSLEWYQIFRMMGNQAMIDAYLEAKGQAMTEAETRWAWKVRQGGDWDHKPKLYDYYMVNLKHLRPYGSVGDMSFYFPIRGDLPREYYYDIWSNIHYGYVGTRCGFTAERLQSAAASNLPFAGTNDEGDVISVQIGIDLWKSTGLSLTVEKLRQAIVAKGDAYEAARISDLKKGVSKDKATNTVIRNNDYK